MKINKILLYPSVLFLIVANSVPIFGILFFNWDIFNILILYWLESAVVGFFNVLRMQRIDGYGKMSSIIFFMVHYAGFMLGHLIFILNISKPDLGSAPDFLNAFLIVFDYLKSLFISLSLLFLSHGLSFMFNFMKKEEYKHTSLRQQMAAPYKRIVLMHLAIVFSAYLTVRMNLAQDMAIVLILVILKIVIDLISHINEHRKNILA